jgi:acyl-CoA reductase-like NAD-dependent aldehyde dehydrogenase
MNACPIDSVPPVPVDPMFDDTTNRTTDDTTALTKDNSVNDLSAVLEQLTITTATAIKAHEPKERDQLFRAFVQSLEKHLDENIQHSVSI